MRHVPCRRTLTATHTHTFLYFLQLHMQVSRSKCDRPQELRTSSPHRLPSRDTRHTTDRVSDSGERDGSIHTNIVYGPPTHAARHRTIRGKLSAIWGYWDCIGVWGTRTSGRRPPRSIVYACARAVAGLATLGARPREQGASPDTATHRAGRAVGSTVHRPAHRHRAAQARHSARHKAVAHK